MDDLVGRDFGLYGIEEADERLMRVVLHTTPDQLAFEQVEGRTECRRAS